MPRTTDPRPPLADLYAELAPQLERIVSANVRATSTVLEEACQTAWAWLIAGRDSLTPGTELGWLATSATREALRLVRAQRRELSLEQEQEAEGELLELVLAPGPERVVEVRERLAEVQRLPPRQQRLVMLQGFGYRYSEISAVTGDSCRTIDRQLIRARRKLAG
jgi:DNA-directed RNA polymerase specialized sigma24 family protein